MRKISRRNRLLCRGFAALAALLTLPLGCPCAFGQEIRVDTTPSKALAFEPDKALGSSMDILQAAQIDKVYSAPILKEALSAGWGPITYRLNTELTIAAWHWNPSGDWSDPQHESGYFLGSTEVKEPLHHTFGYSLPHRGMTRTDASQNKFSMLTDGNEASYWKSNPYLAKKFTGEEDAHLPQWVVIDFDAPQPIDAIRIVWANPYATKYVVQYWRGEDAFEKPAQGVWTPFPFGEVTSGKGGSTLLRLSDIPIKTRFLRIVMTESSGTCDTHGSGDARNCLGYAVNEIYAGNYTEKGEFIDLVTHSPAQNQTATRVSSTDPWHSSKDIVPGRVQTGLDLFYTSGITNKLPAMIPVAMLYSTPEDAAAEIGYVEKRGYPISYIEMGEEPDGKNTPPEDYAALYLQFAAAIHKVDPRAKLGGPVFEGSREDIEVWANAEGKTSWLGRFIDYLKAHGRLSDLAFVSFEHYPMTPCYINWADLYREPEYMKHILDVWRQDGVPAGVPLMVTESNITWSLTEQMTEVLSALWLADNAGSFLENAGEGGVFYHSPIQPEPLRPGCRGYSTYGNFVADDELNIRQHTAQYYSSQMINLEWVKHGAGRHEIFPAQSKVKDDDGNIVVSAYAVKRPDGTWSVMLVNKDPGHAQPVHIAFSGSGKALHFRGSVEIATFGAEQYVWHSEGAKSHAEPDDPPLHRTINATGDEAFKLPKASVTVLRGKIE